MARLLKAIAVIRGTIRDLLTRNRAVTALHALPVIAKGFLKLQIVAIIEALALNFIASSIEAVLLVAGAIERRGTAEIAGL